MCTRFVYRGNDIITGFNFDIDLSVWKHKVIEEKERFYIGILRPDGIYHSYHGVHRNGNVGTLLYVHGNKAGAYQDGPNCMSIADLTEQFIKAEISFEEALQLVKSKKITYAPDATMQTMLSDIHGRVLIVEPGIGYREEDHGYSLLTNASIIKPESTKDFIVQGDDRYERALQILENSKGAFLVSHGFTLLHAVRQEGAWATRVSFIYSAQERTVYYVENNHFAQIKTFSFPAAEQERSNHATEHLSPFKG